ncbi:MAG: hypothetical protein AAF441_15865 [Pseudomonadota bacterium]
MYATFDVQASGGLWEDEDAPGTRFRLYPQSPLDGEYLEPETVYVSSPAGSLRAGPSDHRMYTVFPVFKPVHYGLHEDDNGESFMFLPPWQDESHDPAQPGQDGHFDHLEPGTTQFFMAHVFGATRFTLDVWERYFGRPIDWHFKEDYDRLEISIMPNVDNAFLGWGFLETGGTMSEGKYSPFYLNFDVIAHEVGHAIIYSEIGLPDLNAENPEYFGFHESLADVIALLASLHFHSLTNSMLDNTSGNLYTMNKLSRFAELTSNKQIRLAANVSMLSDFAHGWTSEHALSQPLTGALFDVLVDIFHEELVERGLISPEVEDLSDKLELDASYSDVMQGIFDEAYRSDPKGFKHALLEARDTLGTYLAKAMELLETSNISYETFGAQLIAIDEVETGGRFESIIRNNFVAREIGQVRPGPRLKKPDETSHLFSDRIIRPDYS